MSPLIPSASAPFGFTGHAYAAAADLSELGQLDRRRHLHFVLELPDRGYAKTLGELVDEGMVVGGRFPGWPQRAGFTEWSALGSCRRWAASRGTSDGGRSAIG